MEKYTLIITEKPDAAKRIAQALDAKEKPQWVREKGVPFFIAERDKKIVVVPAIGHYTPLLKPQEGELITQFLILDGSPVMLPKERRSTFVAG